MKTLRTFATANALVLVLSSAAYAGGTYINDAGIEEAIVPVFEPSQIVGSVETRLSDNPADGLYDPDLRKYVKIELLEKTAEARAEDEQVAEIGDIRSDAAPGYSRNDAGHFEKY